MLTGSIAEPETVVDAGGNHRHEHAGRVNAGDEKPG